MYTDELYHYGTLGMRWGIRRYQNKDGTLTALGKKRKSELEQDYKRLTDKDTVKTKFGDKRRRFIKEDYKILTGKNIEKQKIQVQKKLSEMSATEINKLTEELTARRNYLSAQTSLKDLEQQQAKAQRDASKGVMDKIMDSAKKQAEKSITEALDYTITKSGEKIVESMFGVDEKKKRQREKERVADELKILQDQNKILSEKTLNEHYSSEKYKKEILEDALARRKLDNANNALNIAKAENQLKYETDYLAKAYAKGDFAAGKDDAKTKNKIAKNVKEGIKDDDDLRDVFTEDQIDKILEMIKK